MNTNAPQHAGGADAALPLLPIDRTPLVIAPAGLRLAPRIATVDRHIGAQCLALGVPDAGEDVADILVE